MSKIERIFAVITLLFGAFVVMRALTSTDPVDAFLIFLLLAGLPWGLYLLIFRKKK